MDVLLHAIDLTNYTWCTLQFSQKQKKTKWTKHNIKYHLLKILSPTQYFISPKVVGSSLKIIISNINNNYFKRDLKLINIALLLLQQNKLKK